MKLSWVDVFYIHLAPFIGSIIALLFLLMVGYSIMQDFTLAKHRNPYKLIADYTLFFVIMLATIATSVLVVQTTDDALVEYHFLDIQELEIQIVDSFTEDEHTYIQTSENQIFELQGKLSDYLAEQNEDAYLIEYVDDVKERLDKPEGYRGQVYSIYISKKMLWGDYIAR